MTEREVHEASKDSEAESQTKSGESGESAATGGGAGPAPELPDEEGRPGETFKQGLGLLWQAARSAADEIRREVDKGKVGEALQQAGRDLERAATQASGVVEQLIGRLSPADPKTQPWPNSPSGEKRGEQVDPDTPPDGGTTEDGERRDMRIQVESDGDD